jgi:hypothetical protein
MAEFRCPDAPQHILRRKVCLNAASKDVKGRLKLLNGERQHCDESGCKTLKTVHGLKVQVRRHAPCDSKAARPLDGTLVVEKLATVFEQTGFGRGMHAGDFVLQGRLGVVVRGRLSGMTNVGTHRRPHLEGCQKCRAPGMMEGRLCGRIEEAKDPALKGCDVFGTYRLRFEPTADGGSGTIVGAFEGVIVCPCG